MSNDFVKQIVEDLGLGGGTPERQAELISRLGENILNRVMLEILKVLPKGEREKLGLLFDTGSLEQLREFLAARIPDLDAFIRREGQKEIEATRARAHELLLETQAT